MGAWSRLSQRTPAPAVLFAVQHLDPSLGHACEALPGRARAALDPGGKSARRFNALWLPRAYVLDERGFVTYVQPDTTLDPQAPQEVARLWQEGR